MKDRDRYCTTMKRPILCPKPLTIILIISFLSTTSAYDEFTLRYPNVSNQCPPASGTGITYEHNLNRAVSSIISDSNNTSGSGGFYNFSAGQDPDKAFVIGLCVGYVSSTLCPKCLNDTFTRLQKTCPSQKEVVGWEDMCMLRYANRYIFSRNETQPLGKMCSPNNLSDADGAMFIEKRDKLLRNLQEQAMSVNHPRYYKTGQDTVTVTDMDDLNVYGMVQCTPDISASACYQCLDYAIGKIPLECANNTQGGRILLPSCTVRYEKDPFYTEYLAPPDAPPPASPSPPAPAPTTKSKSSLKVIILSVVPTIAVVLALCLWRRLKRRLKRWRSCLGKNGAKDEIEPVESLQFDFKTIEVATDDFSDGNELGQGGFGVVYKGKLDNGQEIAVKRLSQGSGQGQIEFKNEVTLLAKLQHRNLVRLLGFCLHGQERLLVYEFVSNGSLDHHIFDPSNSASLDYETRYKIIGGIARGLLYLHEDSRLTIIHRDLKAGNVLLDTDMNPKIADFGLARLVHANEIFALTSKLMGTFGYMAPEYVIHGKISVKLDVYSFGILVLEIVTGQRNTTTNTNEDDLITFVWKNWRQGRATDIVRAIERADAPKTEMIKCIHIGLLCVQENASDRPTMSTVVLMLNSSSITLPLPSPPSFLSRNNLTPFDYSSYHSIGNATLLSDEPKNESKKSLVNGASFQEFDP